MDLEIAVPHTPGRLAPGLRTTVPVELHNVSDETLRLRLSLTRGRVSDWAVIEPATAELPPGGHRSIEVIFQPPGDATVQAAVVPFTVRAVDAVNAGRSSSATGLVEITGGPLGPDSGSAGGQGTAVAALARSRRWVVVTSAAVAAVAVVGVAAWLAAPRLLERGDPAPGDSGTGSATAAVRRPYVMVDAYPQLGPADRAAAEASLARLTAAGLAVRLVDSLDSDDIADGTDGFWVVLRDGFATAAEADGFCSRYSQVTPRCEVVA